jgi:hypothetical protein
MEASAAGKADRKTRNNQRQRDGADEQQFVDHSGIVPMV